MKKVVGIVRNECGMMTHVVVFDLDGKEKYPVDPCGDAEAKFGNYPVYDEKLHLVGNKGLVILEKTASQVKVMTCAGFHVPEGVEDRIIEKTTRLHMRIVNAAVLTDRDGRRFICTL